MRRAVILVLVGIVSVQFGATVAKSLFDDFSPTSIVWLRLVSSALVLILLVRPNLRGRSRKDWLVVVGFGLSLGSMNWAIYESFQRIPLGIAVTIEFLGPLTVALIGSRRLRDLAWVALAAAGVVLLGFERGALTVPGVLLALLAGTAWACYIVMSARTGAQWEGLDGLAMAGFVAAILLSPYAISQAESGLFDTKILLIGLSIGIFSSVVPYSCELIALRKLPTATFGILMSVEPAAAALLALVVLSEGLAWTQWLAIVCVVLASAGATHSAARSQRRVEPTQEIPLG